MKKLILIATSWMILSSCAKTVKSPDEQSTTTSGTKAQVDAIAAKPSNANAQAQRTMARLVFTRPGTQGGYGWVLYLDRDSWEVPANLPAEFQRENIYVDVAYYTTDKELPNWKEKVPKYYISITQIKQVKQPAGAPQE